MNAKGVQVFLQRLSDVEHLRVPAGYQSGKGMTLEQLGTYKVDARYSRSAQAAHDEAVEAVKALLGGERPAASVSGNGFSVHIMASRRKLFVKDNVATPAPAGRWMGYWDTDLAPYVKKRNYERAEPTAQMQWDARVQLDKYVAHQFDRNHAEFWCRREFDHWWWDCGGADKWMNDIAKAEAEFLRHVRVTETPYTA